MVCRTFTLFLAFILVAYGGKSDQPPFFWEQPTTVLPPMHNSSVRVYHQPRDPRAILGILRHGFLTPMDLFNQGISPRGELAHWSLPRRMETTFFHAPLLPHPELGVAAAPIDPTAPWVVIEVDPWTSYVFNAALWDEYGRSNHDYFDQRMTLAQWLELRHQGLGTARIHPHTGEGVKCVDDQGNRRDGPQWRGHWELLVRGGIPPEKIAGFSYGVPKGSLYPMANPSKLSDRAKARMAAYFLRFMTRGRG